MDLTEYQHLPEVLIDMIRTRIKTSCLDASVLDVGDAVSMYFSVTPSFVLKLCILGAER